MFNIEAIKVFMDFWALISCSLLINPWPCDLGSSFLHLDMKVVFHHYMGKWKPELAKTTTYRTSQLTSQRKIKYELAFASCAIKLQSYCQHNFCLTATVITVVRCRAVTKLHHSHWLDKSVNSYLVLVQCTCTPKTDIDYSHSSYKNEIFNKSNC